MNQVLLHVFFVVFCLGILSAEARTTRGVVGCDGVLGSGLIKDKCGVCGGDNTDCNVFSGDYTEANMAIGYHKAFKIPKGAMYINITEMAKSRNYLALQDSSGVTHINGDWRIDLPGNFTVGGTVFQYKRDARARVGEQFLAMGPTTEDLFVVLIYQTSNPGIHYDYVMPRPDRGQSANPGGGGRDNNDGGGGGNRDRSRGNQQQPTQTRRPSVPSSGRNGGDNRNGNQQQPTQTRQPSLPAAARDRGQVNVNVGQSRGSQTPQRQAFSVSKQPDRYQTDRPVGSNDRSTGLTQTQPYTSTSYYYRQRGKSSSSSSGISSLGPTSALTQGQTGTSTSGGSGGRNPQVSGQGRNPQSSGQGATVDRNPQTPGQRTTGGSGNPQNPRQGTSLGRNPQNPGQGIPYRTGTNRPTETGGRGASGGGRGSTYVPGTYRQTYQPQRYPFTQGGTQSRTYPGGQTPVQTGGGQSPIPTGVLNPGQGGGVNPVPSNPQSPQQGYSPYRQQPYSGRQTPGQTPGRGTSTYSQFFRQPYQTGSGGNPPQGGTPYTGFQSVPNPNNPQQGVPNSQYSSGQPQGGGGSAGNPGPGQGGLPPVLNPYTSIGASLKEHTSGNGNKNRYQPLTGPNTPDAAGYDNTDPAQQGLPNAPAPVPGGPGNTNEGQGNRLFNRLQYMWFETGQTECSVSCGGGLQQSIVKCVQENSFTPVEETLCDSTFKPVPRSRTCNLDPCPPVWVASDWGECSRTCGQGRQLRSVVCKQTYSQSLTTTVAMDRCDQSTKPNTVQDCRLQSCSTWQSGDWGPCSVQCGEGRRQRQLTCVDERSEELGDQACEGLPKPITTEVCDMGTCVAKWFASDWSELCSSECGGGDRTRDVVCATEGNGEVLDDSQCHSDQKPRHTKMCNNMPCGAKWMASLWGQCSAECGEGTQSREVVCVSYTEPFAILPAENCPMGDKPALTQTCTLKECQAKWFNSDWSECSKTCGGGHRTRDAKCLDQSLSPSNACSSEDKPEERQSCNIQQCSLAPPPDDNCRDKFSYCPKVAQARLCSYTYYKKSCCFSCFGRGKR